MKVKEVIEQYDKDKQYMVRDKYEGVYWDREREGSWYDYADGWIDNLDDEEALEVKADAYPEEGIILIIVDTSLS